MVEVLESDGGRSLEWATTSQFGSAGEGGGDFKYKGNIWSSLHKRASLGFSHNLRVVAHNLKGNSSRP